jgi:hypothetical protein
MRQRHASVTFGSSRTVPVESDLDIPAPLPAVALSWAYRTIKPIAEPDAPPNGGPATPIGNSGATEGPPSVS